MLAQRDLVSFFLELSKHAESGVSWPFNRIFHSPFSLQRVAVVPSPCHDYEQRYTVYKAFHSFSRVHRLHELQGYRPPRVIQECHHTLRKLDESDLRPSCSLHGPAPRSPLIPAKPPGCYSQPPTRGWQSQLSGVFSYVYH